MSNSSIYRERFTATLAYQPVDRCPIDLGGTPQSTVEHPDTLSALAEHLGFQGPAPDDYEKFDRRILEHFDIDFRRVGALVPFKTPRKRRLSHTEHIDSYGIRHRFSGLYWEMVEGPLRNATIDDIRAYDFPDIDQAPLHLFDRWADQARYFHEKTPYVVVGEHPVFGVLELACWLCGYDHVMAMLLMDPDAVHLLFQKILALQKKVIEAYYSRLGPWLHLTTSGDDFGTQDALIMSPDLWREFIKPCLAERIAYTAQFTDAVYMHHTCGAVFDIIPDLIEIGVRILNPIQPSAAGMDPHRLKQTYGHSLVFHGGLDTQKALPSNNLDVIEAGIEELLTAMDPARSGGYILAPAHNLQRDVSQAAIAHLYTSALRFFNRSGVI